MKNSATFLLLVIALSPRFCRPQAVPNLNVGSRLFSDCQGSVRFFNDHEHAVPSDFDKAQLCAAYISGFTDALLPSPYTCPLQFTVSTLARVYVAYMEKHPKLLDEPRSTGLIQALVDAYPCPKK